MGVTYDKIIPMKAVDSGEPDSILNEAEVATALIERLSAGCNETVAELEVLSLCVGSGSGCPGIVKRVLEKMKEESAKLRTVSPADYKNGAEYETELAKSGEVILPVVWHAKMREAYNVATFASLKTAVITEKEAQAAAVKVLEQL